jgi:hypothetical protein
MTIYSKTLGKGKYGMHDAEAQNYILHTAARLNLAAIPSQRRALFCSSTHGSQLATRNHPWFAFTTSTTGWIHPINFEREKKSKVSRQHNTCKHWWVPEVTLRTPGKGTEVLFIRLIIRLFQLVFLAETVFFSHNKSANSVFQPAYQHSRTAPERGSYLVDARRKRRAQRWRRAAPLAQSSPFSIST